MNLFLPSIFSEIIYDTVIFYLIQCLQYTLWWHEFIDVFCNKNFALLFAYMLCIHQYVSSFS